MPHASSAGSKPSVVITIVIALLTGCATTPIKQQMREANASLKQAENHAAAKDHAAAAASAEGMRNGVRLGVESAPAVKNSGGSEVDLLPLLAAWESGPYRELQAALASGQNDRAVAAFAATKAQCANCHAVAGRPAIRIHGM